MFRSRVERATRLLVFKRRLPPEFGGVAITVSPSAGLRYLFRPMRSIDPVLLSLASEFVKPGAVVWDIGANIGLFSFSAAQRAGSAGQVVAVEPDLWLVRLLRRTSALQPPSSARVTVVPCAVASSVGIRTFSLAARSRAANSLVEYGSSQTGGESEKQTVVTLTLDSLVTQLPAPDVIKIDTEGAEFEVFQGARRLFESKRPVVLCEVSNEKAPAVTEFLVSFGYRLFDGEAPSATRQPLSVAPWCTIAVPA
jgi:FkbM family methyltransferase